MTRKESLRELVKGSGISFVGSLFSKSIHYIFYFLIARALGAEGVGAFSTLLAVLGFARIIAMLGLTGGVNRYVAYYRGQDDYMSVRGTIQFALLAVGAVGVVIGGGIYLLRVTIVQTLLNDTIPPVLLVFVAVIVPLEGLMDITMNALRGFKRLDYQVFAQNILQGLTKVLGLSLVLLIGSGGLQSVLMAYGAAVVVTLLTGVYLLELRTYQVFRGPATYKPTELLVFSAPLLLTSTLTLVVNWTDVLMINYFGTNAQTGIYNIALQTGLVLQLAFSSFSSIVSPTLSEEVGAKNWGTLESTLKTANKWILVLTVPMFTFLLPFARDVIRLFGPEFVRGAEVVLIIGFALVLKTTVGLTGTLLTSLGHSNVNFWNHLIAAVLNVALNFLLIPQFGVVGAATATGVAIILNGIMPAIEVYIWKDIHVIRYDFLHPVVAALGATAISAVGLGWLPSIHYLLVLLLGIIYLSIYAILFMAIGGLQEQDIYILQAMKERTGFKSPRLERFIRRFI